MHKYAIYHSPGFDGQSEGMIHIWAWNPQDAINEVLHVSGIGHRDGNTVFPKTVNRCEDICPKGCFLSSKREVVNA